jgi:hypothetical protein
MFSALLFNFTFLLFASLVSSSPLPQQFSLPVPIPVGKNATLRGNATNEIFCVTPSPWFSGVAIFYLGNYASHAATLITYPGEPPLSVAAAILYALFFPTAGISRGLSAIFRAARLIAWRRKGGDLGAAARSGALCMVVRSSDWRPKLNKYEKAHWKVVEGTWAKVWKSRLWDLLKERRLITPQEMPKWWPYFDTSLERPKAHRRPRHQDKLPWYKRMMQAFKIQTERKIHGTIVLPENGAYTLAFVPRNAVVRAYNHSYVDTSCVEEGTKSTPSTGTPTISRAEGIDSHDYEMDNLRQARGDAAAPASQTTRARAQANGNTTNGSTTNGVNAVGKAPEDFKAPSTLSSSYSVVRTTIALIQILYASFTLYKATKGPQIEQYGYAAFGLTVIP